MMMADGLTSGWIGDVEGAANDDDMCMDMDSFLSLLDEDPLDESSTLNGPLDPLLSNEPSGELVSHVADENPQFHVGSLSFSPSDHSEASATRTGCSSGSLESEKESVNFGFHNVECRPDFVSSRHYSGSPIGWSGWAMPVTGNTAPYLANYGVSEDFSSSCEHHNREAKFNITNNNRSFGVEDGAWKHQLMGESVITDGMNCDSAADNYKISEACHKVEAPNNVEPLIPFSGSFDNGYPNDELPMSYFTNMKESTYLGPSGHCQNLSLHPVTCNDRMLFNVKSEGEDHLMHSASVNSALDYDIHAERAGGITMVDIKPDIGSYLRAKGSNICLSSCESSSDTPGKDSTAGSHLPHIHNMQNKRQGIFLKGEKDDAPVVAPGTAHLSEVANNLGSQKTLGLGDWRFADMGLSQTFPGVLKKELVDIGDACKSNTPLDDRPMDARFPGIPFLQSQSSIKKQFPCKEERESKYDLFSSLGSSDVKKCQQAVQSNMLGHVTYIDDDPDICILEDMSEPARKKPSPVDVKLPVPAQKSSVGAPQTNMGCHSARIKTNDERIIYRVALQDLSQPKSEASPPDGVLAVPLLRHQRIALSWMVHKETKSMHCLGGILADDQGLGKTISTIALILKERSPSFSVDATETKQNEMETLTLDDDDDDTVMEVDKFKVKVESCPMPTNSSSTERRRAPAQAKSKPAAGTLVVCPTSVLRQWNEELLTKVSSKANLSVLVYHGGNRTKDPLELAKYDVVLTTYAIVSMEVPKQPLVDEDDDETKRRNEFLPVGVSSSKKRKYPPSSGKSSKKDKKGLDSELYESLARPLAKVRWFRVILDEAQSIKNHRTQVARACWGLRAKRRWCLSGTPIQNAIDDLYSYFRFLKYEPYAAYKSFCSTIKAPIQRSPTNGYRKLQAVLKTIMLRRTKGTLLDGEPIISLPPKSVKLKKVDFTSEERDFYCRLEADSRAQFAEYAAAGTVKQNYVNILLMLLRLRQACDHPLLVRGLSSNAEWRSSVEKAKKLPLEKRSRLLNCLEDSLAICGICNDPPEDAVVTTCEHVFCNQCILEHLSSDDSQCPSANCKSLLSASSVFSKSTLQISVSDQSDQSSAPDCGDSSEVLEPSSSSRLVNSNKIDAAEARDSSKIKAALEVLQCISRPCPIEVTADSISSIGGCSSSPEKSLNAPSGHFVKDSSVKGNPVVREKAIVFSQWTRMLDLLEACLKDSSICYRRLDGTMSVLARDKAVKDFNTIPEVTVMIMSLKAASLGLNMVAACHVLLLDLWWNPTTEDQAIDRAHRIGQTRPVTVLRLTVKDTVEDRILALQQKKREMVSSAFGEDETGSRQTRLTVDDLKYLFQAS